MKRTLACIALVVLAAASARAQAVDGAAVFAKACASCHADGQTSAPTPAALRALPAESILNALTNGRMQVQGSTLTAAERSAVALFAAGRGARDAIAATSGDRRTSARRPAPMANAAHLARLERLGQRRREHALREQRRPHAPRTCRG